MKLDLVKDCAFVLIIARRGSGKSELLKHFIKKLSHGVDKVFLISPSVFNGQFNGVVHPSCIMEDYSEEFVDRLITRMRAENSNKDRHHKDFKRVLLVMDDCISSNLKTHHSKTLHKLATRGRHCGIAVLFTAQWAHSVSPVIRFNSDVIFYGLSNSQSHNILFKEMNPTGMPKQEFMNMIERNTRNYRFLVISNKEPSNDPTRVYGSFKLQKI